MADTNTTATSTVSNHATTSVQAKKSSNIISLLAPVICILMRLHHLAFRYWQLQVISRLPILQVASGQNTRGQKVTLQECMQGELSYLF